MRLSEDRINAIAHKIAHDLMKKRLVLAKSGGLRQLAACVEKPIIDDLRREETIDEEVRDILRSQTTCPPEGSFEYQALFQKRKEDLARRKGYTL